MQRKVRHKTCSQAFWMFNRLAPSLSFDYQKNAGYGNGERAVAGLKNKIATDR